MAAKHFQKPTEAELEILQILWQNGPCTVKKVNDLMNEKKEVRKDEDKIRIFLAWLKDAEDLTPKAKSYLREVAALAAKKGQE